MSLHWSTVQRHDIIDATFRPKRIDSLRPGMARWVGYRGRFCVWWTVTPEDGGPYVGQYAIGPEAARCVPGHMLPLDGLWAPQEDFELHGVLRGEWDKLGSEGCDD